MDRQILESSKSTAPLNALVHIQLEHVPFCYKQIVATVNDSEINTLFGNQTNEAEVILEDTVAKRR